MGACQADAGANERPHAGDQAAANRDHLQRTSGALRKSENAESGFEWLFCAANDHQTEVHNGTPNEQSN